MLVHDNWSDAGPGSLNLAEQPAPKTSMTQKSRYLSLLIADDDPDDLMLFADAVAEISPDLNLQIVKDGDELINFLNSAIILPNILFLDLNMPRRSGFQCLDEIKKNPVLKDILIIVYSTTANQREVDEVFLRGGDKFIRKPNSYTELKHILTVLFREEFGLAV